MARKQISNAAALRESFEKNGIDAPIDTHQTFLMNEYKIDMSRQQVSQYRSAEKRKILDEAGEAAPTPKASAAYAPRAPKVVAVHAASHAVGDSIVGLIAAVKASEDNIGKESTRQILSVLLGGK